MQDHYAKGAQVQGKHWPILLCHLQTSKQRVRPLGPRGQEDPQSHCCGQREPRGIWEKTVLVKPDLRGSSPDGFLLKEALLLCTCTPAQLATLIWVWLVPLLVGQLPRPSPEATLPTSVLLPSLFAVPSQGPGHQCTAGGPRAQHHPDPCEPILRGT